MTFVYPIPTQRSSDYLVQRRLLSQLQSDQAELLRIQTQISTGRRISRPSEDPAAAARGIGLQRILEEKQQVRVNLNTNSSYLAATDSSLATVSNLIAQMRAVAVGAAQNTISDSERAANSIDVERAVQQLVDIGNHKFRGRYLFAGTNTTSPPFAFSQGSVAYSGNEMKLQSYSDVDLLSDSSLPGTEVFGAISPAIRGRADLNPVLTRQTRLSDLRGGLGISLGSIEIADGSNSQTIDLSRAKSIDDVIRAIESQPPAGRTVVVRPTPIGLNVDLDDAGGGNLTIRDLSDGTTAAELGISNTLGTGVNAIVGADLNPRLKPNTRLSDLLGTKATAYVPFAGANNDLIIESTTNGPAANGVTVQFVDDGLLHASTPLTAGNETVSFTSIATPARAALRLFGLNNNLLLTSNSPGTVDNDVRIDIVGAGAIGNAATVSYVGKVLTLGIDSAGATSAQTLINAINAHGMFTAASDASDPTDGAFMGTASIPSSNIATGVGNTGNSGAAANTLLVNISPGHTSANDVVKAINEDAIVQALFRAQLDPADNRLAVNLGRGLVDVEVTAQTSGGTGQILDLTAGLRITNGGTSHTVDVSAAKTMEDLTNILNRSAAHVTAKINADGSGLDVRSTLSGVDFSIGENGGQTATQLGIRSLDAKSGLNELNYGRGVATAPGTDFRILRSDGVEVLIDISNAHTIQDVLDAINVGGGLTAHLAEYGNGIVIDDASGGPGPLVITRESGSDAVWDLGLIPVNQGSASGTGSPPRIAGKDVNPQEVNGVFNSLIRLKKALLENDGGTIERTVRMLDEDLSRLTFARSHAGAQQQGLDALRIRLDDEGVELQRALSEEIDADLPESISALAARQAALEASLQLTSRVFQLTLLDFL